MDSKYALRLDHIVARFAFMILRLLLLNGLRAMIPVLAADEHARFAVYLYGYTSRIPSAHSKRKKED